MTISLIERYYRLLTNHTLHWSSGNQFRAAATTASLLRMASLHPTSPISDLTNPPEASQELA